MPQGQTECPQSRACPAKLLPMNSSGITYKACIHCRYLDRTKAECTAGSVGSPLRRCLIGLVQDEISRLPSGLRVLEIGCGSWGFVRDLVQARGCQWEGIEPATHDSSGNPSIATKQGVVDRIPYQDETFDFVISNQSIEHWHEFQSSFAAGIAEIWRVLKVGGTASLNFPLWFHGHPIFKAARMESIKGLLAAPYWEQQEIEVWRSESAPLPDYFHPGEEKSGKPARLGVMRARKASAGGRLSPGALWFRYLISGQIRLINPLPSMKVRLQRLRGRRFLHHDPTGVKDKRD